MEKEPIARGFQRTLTMNFTKKRAYLFFFALTFLLAGCQGIRRLATVPEGTQSTSTEAPSPAAPISTLAEHTDLTPTASVTTLATTIPMKTGIASPTISGIALETPEIFTLTALDKMSLYYISYGIAYDVIPRKETSINNPRAELTDSLDLKFSHFSNLVAYWKDRTHIELWISDLDGHNPRVIFTDTQQIYYVPRWPLQGKNVELIWSPDDRYLIIQANGIANADLLYDVEMGKIQAWNYHCDRIALSPRSKRIATWCQSRGELDRFAVLEWGGDIWYSDFTPTQELVRRTEDQPVSWEWSSDGNQIAFFDPSDMTGSFYIADTLGKIRLMILPGSAYWMSEEPSLAIPDSPPVQWSKDGSRILIYAIGDKKHPCPTHVDTTIDQGQTYVVPCWMVLDSVTGDVVWTLSEFSTKIDYSGHNIQKWFFRNAAISPDGNYLAIAASYSGLSSLEYVDLRTNQVVTLVDGLYINAIRWNN